MTNEKSKIHNRQFSDAKSAGSATKTAIKEKTQTSLSKTTHSKLTINN